MSRPDRMILRLLPRSRSARRVEPVPCRARSGSVSVLLAGALTLLAVAALPIASSAPATAATTWSGFEYVDPVRQVDTRRGLGGDRLTADVERFLPLAAVPAGVAAVTVNVTVVDADGDGHLVVTDCASGADSSAVNFARSRVTPNQVTVGVGTNGPATGICVTASRSSHLVVDLFGVATGLGDAAFVPRSARELDTRSDGGAGSDGVLVLDVARHGVGGTLMAWSGTVTVTDVLSTGFVTVFPCALPRPEVSSLNLAPGVTTANQVTVRLPSTDARVCVYVDGQTQIVVDTNGVWLPDTDQTFSPSSPPVRIIDTRHGGPLSRDEVRRLHTGTDAVLFMNVTATRADGNGWLALFPCGAGYGGTSTLNVRHGEDVSSAAIVSAADGGVCVTGSVGTHVVVDVFGVQHRRGTAVPTDTGVPLGGHTMGSVLHADSSAPLIGRCRLGSMDPFNHLRGSVGLPALVGDHRTDAFACEWATEMARADRMSHSVPHRRAGVDACGVNGENVAAGGSDWAWMADAWIASTTHRDVILHDLLHRGSVAYVERSVAGRSTWFGVMIFGGSC
ncbi:MAG: CAP domain-containing protein [Ilumatobacter sp.]|nr:MAG: CAP domain-containing protein [Ilumatobacter sp.]